MKFQKLFKNISSLVAICALVILVGINLDGKYKEVVAMLGGINLGLLYSFLAIKNGWWD